MASAPSLRGARRASSRDPWGRDPASGPITTRPIGGSLPSPRESLLRRPRRTCPGDHPGSASARLPRGERRLRRARPAGPMGRGQAEWRRVPGAIDEVRAQPSRHEVRVRQQPAVERDRGLHPAGLELVEGAQRARDGAIPVGRDDQQLARSGSYSPLTRQPSSKPESIRTPGPAGSRQRVRARGWARTSARDPRR